MASVAYRPEMTQAPYRAFAEVIRSGFLQSDLLVPNGDVEPSFEHEAPAPEVTAPRVVSLPDRFAFKRQYEQWLQDSLFDSLPERMTRHDSYKAIVAQGERVVPLIAAELRKEPSFLFLALEDITRSDPVPAEVRGNLKATVAAWLSWLRR